MGGFPGHLLVGSMYIIVGLWWTLNVVQRYFSAKVRHSASYKNSCFFLWRDRVPVEEYIIFVSSSLFIAGEVLAHFPQVQIQNRYHIASTVCLIVTAAVSLLERRKWWIPPGTSYVLLGLSFAVEVILMYFHAHRGVPTIEALMHTLFNLTTCSMCVCCFLELSNPNSVLVALARGYSIMLHGIWFTHGAYLIYDNMGFSAQVINATGAQVMMIPVYFAYDCALSLLVVVAIGMFQYQRIKSQEGYEELRLLFGEDPVESGKKENSCSI